MAFCCSSARDRDAPNDRWKHRAAASAAVDLTNLVLRPGRQLPTKSLLSHDKDPNTRDLAGNVYKAQHRDEGYYGNLQAPSPAAPLPPLQARSIQSNQSTASTAKESPRGPAPNVMVAPSLRTDAAYQREVEAWQREVARWKMELESCLHELGDAIISEDFERATQLKKRRDELQSRAMPPRPVLPQAVGKAAWDDRLYRSPDSNSFKSYSTVDTVSQGARTQSERGGLGFLFTVWQHNPEHTSTPDNVHA